MIDKCGCKTINNPDCTTETTGITTPTCSDTIVCEYSTWTNCITYGGADIGCAITVGGVSTFTSSGTAGDTGSYTTTGLTATGGSGTGAIFSVAGSLLNTNYTVTVTTAGSGYQVGDVLTIAGDDVQGTFASPTNDVTITVTALSNSTISIDYQIFTDDSLNDVIKNLNDRICVLTPEGLDYSGFDYSCLRQGGNIQGVGSAITTAQQFTEATAAALCDIDERLDLIENPDLTFTCLSVTDADDLWEVLTKISNKICEIDDVISLPITVTPDCFTTAPASDDTLSDWFQWVVDNVCSIRTALLSSISTQTTRINNINTYLTGGTSPSYPITYDLTCMSGGATANVDEVLEELISQVCDINTTLGGYPDLSAIVLSWASCFSSSPYSYTNSSQSLQTQLERILNVISREKITTFSADFDVTDSSCGKTVALAAGVGEFTCANLESCSIHDLGDVQDTLPGSGESGEHFKWNNATGEYELFADDTFTNIGVVDKSGSYSAEPLGFYFKAPSGTEPYQKAYSIGFVEDSWTAISSFQPNYGTSVSDPLNVKKTWDGHLLLKGVLNSVSSPSTNALDVPGGTALFTLPAGFFPTAAIVNMNLNITWIPISPSDTPITLAGYITISGSSGLVTFYCNDGDSATTAASITAFGNNDAHAFSFTGKAIYQ